MNDALRSHVTRVGFNLSLSVGQIAVLIGIDKAINEKSKRLFQDNIPSHLPWAWSVNHSWVTGLNGCKNRGLIDHHFDERYASTGPKAHLNHIGRHYSITKAGKLVLELLKEAGIYQEIEPTLIFNTAA